MYKIFLEISILYSYYCGLNNVAHFWYSIHWKEYDEYGKNEKTHEIIINITRCTVIIIVSFIATLAFIISCIVFDYIIISYASNVYLYVIVLYLYNIKYN